MQEPVINAQGPRPGQPPRGFSIDEYRSRCSRLQERMNNVNIDLLWLSTDADIRYFTGFLTQFWQSPTRPWYLLIPATGEPVAVIPAIGAVCMQRTWIQDIRCWSSPHPSDDGVTLLVDTCNELAGVNARIGVPMGAETWVRCPWNDLEKIRSLLSRASWVDATDALRSVRRIKSGAEIDKLHYICSVTSDAFDLVPAIIRAGMSEIDAFRAFRIACLQCGADDPAYVVGAASSGGYNDIISPPSEHMLTSGDVLILDTGCTFDGYYSDFDRNFAVKHVDEATRTAYRCVWEATEAGLAAIKPGATCASVFNAMQSVMQPLSDNSLETGAAAPESAVGRLGHGLGIQLTETPSITPFDHTPLLPGMVMTLEPGYSYLPGKMMVHEENVVVTETGVQLLSRRASSEITILE